MFFGRTSDSLLVLEDSSSEADVTLDAGFVVLCLNFVGPFDDGAEVADG